MELKEKIELVEKLKNDQSVLKEELEDAEKNNDANEVSRIKEEIKNIVSKIKEVSAEFQSQMEERTEYDKANEEANSLLKKGNDIDSKIEEYTELLNNSAISVEDKQKVEAKLESLTADKNKLKGEIYGAALKRSGLEYNSGEISSMAVVKKHVNQVNELKKEREEIERQKEKQQEIINQRKSDMAAQLDIAVEKYREMLINGKISPELYEKRIVSMKDAKEKDFKMLDNSLEEFDLKLKENDEEMAEAEKYIDDYQEKFKIYDEYDKVYQELFGGSLDKFAKERYNIMKDSVKDNKINTEDSEIVTSKPNIEKEDNDVITFNENSNSTAASKGQQNVVVGSSEAKEVEKEESPKIVITSKTMFDELYKKLSKGNITDSELTALSEVLSNQENYDKYNITTGKVFNKARKILKAQGGRMAKNIDYFLSGAFEFSDDIKFSTDIENADILSHDALNSWKEISKDDSFADKELSVEKYIAQIEKYKMDGNKLTDEQARMYEEAMQVKEKIVNYKKSVKTNHDVTNERSAKMQNSALYNMFKNKIGNNQRRTLPEAEDSSRSNEVIGATGVIDLSSMVQNEITSEELEQNEAIVKTKDEDMQR